MNNKKKFKLLDCTLRDGGYYNNWNFSLNLIQDYLNIISKTGIQYIELGFRSFPQNKNLGLTGVEKQEEVDDTQETKIRRSGS